MNDFKNNQKKFLVFFGGLLGLVGIVIPFFDQTMAWWRITFDPDHGETWTYYLMPDGYIENSENNDKITIDVHTVELISGIIILGSLLILIGVVRENKNLAIAGTVIIILGLIYFLYAIGNIEEVQDLFAYIDTPKNYIYGEDAYSRMFLGDVQVTWTVGGGFFVSTLGAILSCVGLYEKKK